MDDLGERVASIRGRRMWTQARLAREAGLSPTTISGIESGRIARPHFGTVRKLARALGVEAEELASGSRPVAGPASLSLEWAMSSSEEEFERGLEGASMAGLSSLSRGLGEEQERLRKLYGEVSGDGPRRILKGMIRHAAANSGSVDASISVHPDAENEGKV
ncbi:helix-turn-helix domain-containing protein [Rubrobacter tropicus]|nr:helix-turn-helix transcriptional regulator [Rubrobacter tropicus]